MHIYIDDNSNPLKEFQLPADFLPELSRTNPFLTDEGSQSIPLTLPASDHNMKLIRFPYRITASNRPVRKLAAILSEGTSWMRGTLYIDKANPIDGIECTFYTNEGQLYEKMKDIRLNDIAWPKIEGSGFGYESRARYWMDKFLDIMEGRQVQPDEYYIFSVQTDQDFIPEKIPSDKIEFTRKLILNETQYDGTSLSFTAYEAQKYKESDTVFTVPVGYGITPFLRLGYVLRIVMAHIGYVLESNIFDTDTSLKRLVILNNTADSICNGYLDFSQLLPTNLLIEDLINTVRKKFGVEFITGESNHVIVKLFENELKQSPDMDLSQYVTGEITIEAQDPKGIAFKMERSLSPYSDTKTENWDEFKKAYPQYLNQSPDIIYSALIKRATTFNLSTQQFVKYGWAIRGENENHDYAVNISSPFFDTLPPDGMEEEDISPGDVCVPLSQFYGYNPLYKVYDHLSMDITKIFRAKLPFIGNIRHLNTEILNNDPDKSVPEDKEENLQLMMCFSCPGKQSYTTNINNEDIPIYYYYSGSSIAFDATGKEWGTVSLVSIGFEEKKIIEIDGKPIEVTIRFLDKNLYSLFYKERDEMLQQANQLLTFYARIPTYLITTMNIATPKVVNGQRIMIERIDYVLKKQNLCQVTARTLHKYDNE